MPIGPQDLRRQVDVGVSGDQSCSSVQDSSLIPREEARLIAPDSSRPTLDTSRLLPNMVKLMAENASIVQERDRLRDENSQASLVVAELKATLDVREREREMNGIDD